MQREINVPVCVPQSSHTVGAAREGRDGQPAENRRVRPGAAAAPSSALRRCAARTPRETSSAAGFRPQRSSANADPIVTGC
jgi:hypothetical protein